MLQIIEGKMVYVVEFDTMPELPIKGLTAEEEPYERLLSSGRGYVYPFFDPDYPKTGEYAEILTEAFEKGIITEPGKYGIHIDRKTQSWSVSKIIEN